MHSHALALQVFHHQQYPLKTNLFPAARKVWTFDKHAIFNAKSMRTLFSAQEDAAPNQ